MKFLISILFLFSSTLAQANAIKTREITFNPIVYGIGAAGITFKSSFFDAQKVLTPIADKDDISTDPWTVTYKEGVTISWDETTLTPRYITVFPNYVGPIRTSNSGISVSMNQNFSNRYSATLAGAEQLARHLFQTFENAEADFDCIDVKICKVDWGTRNGQGFDVLLPGMQLNFSKNPIILESVTVLNPNRLL